MNSRSIKGIKKIKGANMDIDLVTEKSAIPWEQDLCPWNQEEGTNEHKCAVKNISICSYFCGIEHLDTVLCSYPQKDPKNNQKIVQ